eukprot:scaffold2507_cov122-Isochrysis_galbana.AAC.6
MTRTELEHVSDTADEQKPAVGRASRGGRGADDGGDHEGEWRWVHDLCVGVGRLRGGREGMRRILGKRVRLRVGRRACVPMAPSMARREVIPGLSCPRLACASAQPAMPSDPAALEASQCGERAAF